MEDRIGHRLLLDDSPYLIFNNTWYYFTWYSKPVVQDWNWAASVCLIGSRQIPSVNLASSETWKSFLFNGSFKNYIAKLYKTVFFSSFVLIKYKSNQSCLFGFPSCQLATEACLCLLYLCAEKSKSKSKCKFISKRKCILVAIVNKIQNSDLCTMFCSCLGSQPLDDRIKA